MSPILKLYIEWRKEGQVWGGNVVASVQTVRVKQGLPDRLRYDVETRVRQAKEMGAPRRPHAVITNRPEDIQDEDWALWLRAVRGEVKRRDWPPVQVGHTP